MFGAEVARVGVYDSVVACELITNIKIYGLVKALFFFFKIS